MKNVFYDLKIENSISVHCKYFHAKNKYNFSLYLNFKVRTSTALCELATALTAPSAVEVQFTALPL